MIRLCLGWGGVVLGYTGCRLAEKFQGLWGKSRSSGMTSCCIKMPAAQGCRKPNWVIYSTFRELEALSFSEDKGSSTRADAMILQARPPLKALNLNWMME